MQVVMDESRNLDLSALTFEEFERLFFDHPILRAKNGLAFEDAFCPGMSSFASSSPAKTVELLERLMREFKRIGARYALEQIDQGVWALFGPAIEIQEHLWMGSVGLELRQRCVRAMVVPYREFVCGHSAEVMENCFEMWWDLIAGAFWARSDFGPHQINDDDKAIVDTMFSTLCEILALPDARCQAYALHGLGHVRHPGVRRVVQEYIDSHRGEFEPDALVWVEKCRDGTVM